MEWLNFRHLYAFWMVVRAGGFTRAAERMHVAQSAVSAHVAALEEYLDEKLLLRHPRSIEPTPAGRELLGFANAIFAQSRAINALIRDKHAVRETQTLRVGVVGGASRNFVYRLLDRYIRGVPDAHLSVSTGSYEELYGMLRRFELDAIVTLDLPRKKDLSDVSFRKLGESDMCVVGVPSLIGAIRRGEVDGPLDVFKFRHPFEVNVLDRHVRSAVGAEVVLRMDTDDVPLLRFYANSGRGVAVIPRVGVLEDLQSGRVEAIPLTRCPEVNIYGITMHQAQHPALADDADVELWPSTPDIADPGPA